MKEKAVDKVWLKIKKGIEETRVGAALGDNK